MADFCWQCLEEGIYPEHPEKNDFYGFAPQGWVAKVLCEGCGVIYVDHEGKRVTSTQAERSKG